MCTYSTIHQIRSCVKNWNLKLTVTGTDRGERTKQEKDWVSGCRPVPIDAVASLTDLAHQGGLSWGLYCIPRQHRWQQKALRDQQITLPFLQQEGKLRGGRWDVQGEKKKTWAKVPHNDMHWPVGGGIWCWFKTCAEDMIMCDTSVISQQRSVILFCFLRFNFGLMMY